MKVVLRNSSGMVMACTCVCAGEGVTMSSLYTLNPHLTVFHAYLVRYPRKLGVFKEKTKQNSQANRMQH